MANHQPAENDIDEQREEEDRQDGGNEIAVQGPEEVSQSSDSVIVFCHLECF